MKKKMDLKTVLSVTAVVLLFALLFTLANMLLAPKYMTDLVEGSMLSQYYDEAGGHDVIFIGDCEVYANITPLELYRSQGITGYNRGSSQQLIWQSYYILAETLKYETPKVVVYNVNAMRYSDPNSEPASEAFNRLTIDKMRWSEEKIGIIRSSMQEEEDFMSYVFPILRYHSRFDELTAEDFQYLFCSKRTTWNGHLMNTAVNPVTNLPAKRPLPNYQFADNCYDYLDKMRQLCEENGVELVLMKAPSLYPYWYDEYDAQISQYAQEHGLSYYNFTAMVDEIGLDFTQDTYDAGLHLNLDGATKFTTFFAAILAEDHGLADHRSDPVVAQKYDELLRLYDEEAAKQKGQ